MLHALLHAWRHAGAESMVMVGTDVTEGKTPIEHRIRTPTLQLQSPYLPFQSVFFTITTSRSRCRIARGLDIVAQVQGIRCLCENSAIPKADDATSASAEAQSSSEATPCAPTLKPCKDCRFGQCERCSCRCLVWCEHDSAHDSFLYLEYFARREDILAILN